MLKYSWIPAVSFNPISTKDNVSIYVISTGQPSLSRWVEIIPKIVLLYFSYFYWFLFYLRGLLEFGSVVITILTSALNALPVNSWEIIQTLFRENVANGFSFDLRKFSVMMLGTILKPRIKLKFGQKMCPGIILNA